MFNQITKMFAPNERRSPSTSTSRKLALSAVLFASCCLVAVALARDPPLRPSLRSHRALASTRTPNQASQVAAASSARPQPAAQNSPPPSPAQAGAGSAVEIAPPANKPISILQPARAAPAIALATGAAAAAAAAAATAAVATPTGINRTARTADVFQNGDGYNIFVTNTCERDSMKVNIKTSRPFNGVIHTQNHRQKPVCRVEGNGETDFNLEISHVLNTRDPNYCGVINPRKSSPEDKDILSVVVVVRILEKIELSDDKFFLLNCTNRCTRPDCSSNPSARLRASDEGSASGEGEREGAPRDLDGGLVGANPNSGSGNGSGGTNDTRTGDQDECTIWKFPWAITLLWCLGILLLAMIISHCIMCSSMVCRCVKTEVEEREPSVYEISDNEDDAYNKRHPYRIDYDNRDIYKTSNNYEPYKLEEAQSKSRKKHAKHGGRDNYR